MKKRVVVVGAGLGGCTVADALSGFCDVTVVEFGAVVTDMQSRIVDVGVPARLDPHVGAGLGGSTALWHNALVEIDEDVFRRQWPFDKAVLVPWYERAYPMLGDVQRSAVLELAALVAGKYSGAGVRAEIAQAMYMPLGRRNVWQSLGLRQKVRVVAGEAVRLVVGDTNVITGVVVRTDDGEVMVDGDLFILAAGGLGTPALLQGLERELPLPALQHAGRHYEDHPQTFVGQVQLSVPLYRFWNHEGAGGNLRLPLVFRREDGLHVSFQLRPAALRLREDRAERLGSIITRVRNEAWNPINWFRLLRHWDDILDILSLKFGIRIPTSHYSIFMLAEQPPAPERAVTAIVDESTGRRLIERRWELPEPFIRSLGHAIERFVNGLGTIVTSATVTTDWPSTLQTAAHHSGTARMSRTPEDGVCDENGRVFGLENLYVADGAAIPGSGIANTGLTIAALALRMADHIRRRGAA
jgi:hypothetical protein